MEVGSKSCGPIDVARQPETTSCDTPKEVICEMIAVLEQNIVCVCCVMQVHFWNHFEINFALCLCQNWCLWIILVENRYRKTENEVWILLGRIRVYSAVRGISVPSVGEFPLAYLDSCVVDSHTAWMQASITSSHSTKIVHVNKHRQVFFVISRHISHTHMWC